MISIGIISCGYWGAHLVRNFSTTDNWVVKVVSDSNEKRLQFLRENYENIDITPDCTQLLDDPELDAIVIATPPSSHYELGRGSLVSRKHTFVEKPLALRASQARELVDMADAVEKVLMVGHTVIYNNGINMVKDIIASGEIGPSWTACQGVVYGLEQFFHAPGKLSTMVLEVAARALTKHALNVHCGHDDVYAALDAGWIVLFAKDAQQAADQALILRRVTELSLTPGMNVQDGFLTSHLERTFYRHEAELIREFLGAPDDIIDCPTEAQRILFGPKRRRVPRMIDLTNPVLLGPVQNQEHYMQGVVARRNNFAEPILRFLEDAHEEFGKLTGRYYGLLTQYKAADAETVFVSLGSAAENIEAAVDHLRRKQQAKVGSLDLNVVRPFPEAAVVEALRGKKHAIVATCGSSPPACRGGRRRLSTRSCRTSGTSTSRTGSPTARRSRRTSSPGSRTVYGVAWIAIVLVLGLLSFRSRDFQ